MKSFIDRMKECDDYMELGGVSEEIIKNAEAMLGISFADDYRAYLVKCGIATVDGHEFTGLGRAKRLDVVTVTMNERKRNPHIPKEMYVIETIGMDRVVIWQDYRGFIYQSVCNDSPNKIAESLQAYL